jgi:5-deoxy-glucuronate isomerase
VTDLHWPAGSLRDGPWSTYLTPEAAGWRFSGFGVGDVAAGQDFVIDSGSDEAIILPLAGSFEVAIHADPGHPDPVRLTGRRDVWAGPTDFLFVPPGTGLTVTSPAGGRFAMPFARAERRFPIRHVAAEAVAVELRGAGNCSREVRNFAAADRFEADRLIAVEVLSPGGNWGSYPPHKHDEIREGETELEEVYHYIVADGPAGPGLAYQHVYGTPERPIDLLTTVRTGDTVLVPHGWHGPAMAAPGYDLYYLNVMAGPGERAWRACDDPSHGWVREAWAGQAIDPRLPFTRTG